MSATQENQAATTGWFNMPLHHEWRSTRDFGSTGETFGISKSDLASIIAASAKTNPDGTDSSESDDDNVRALPKLRMR